MSPHKGETAVHGCQCLGDMAVRMRELLARPWVSLCMPLVWSLPSYNVRINLRTHANFWLSLCLCQKVEKVIGDNATARDTFAFACYASIGSKLPLEKRDRRKSAPWRPNPSRLARATFKQSCLMVSAHCAHYSGLRRCKRAEKQMESIPLILFCAVYYVLSMSPFFFLIWNWLVDPVPKVLNRVVHWWHPCL